MYRSTTLSLLALACTQVVNANDADNMLNQADDSWAVWDGLDE